MAEPGVATGADALSRARACVGARLDDIGGDGVGRIERVLVDAVDGRPTWLVVRTRRFARRSCVPVDVVALAAGHAWAPYRRETIRASSEIDSAAGLICADERELAAHFGMPQRAERLLAIADREDADDGSIPA
jgi:hypothetical protein